MNALLNPFGLAFLALAVVVFAGVALMAFHARRIARLRTEALESPQAPPDDIWTEELWKAFGL